MEERIICLANAGCNITLYRLGEPDSQLYRCDVAMAGVDPDGEMIWELASRDELNGRSAVLNEVRHWLVLTPLFVHPDFREDVWTLFENQLQTVDPTRQAFLARKEARWRLVCGRPQERMKDEG
jgi:hypothetical protein